METLLQPLLQPFNLFALSIFAALLAWERLAPARRLPVVKGWALRATISIFAYFMLSSYLPLLWTAHLFQFQLFDLSHLDTWQGTIVGLLVYHALAYAWHRALHGSSAMWLGFHQMHHSAERLEANSAMYFSPMDMLGWIGVASVALTLVVGLSPGATTATLLIATFLALFTHTNVRTPRWLGYLIERPESHSWHHARGSHRYNYSEIPLFDMLFGTFRNRKDFAPEAGFYDGASSKVGAMLAFRDVSTPVADRT
ncbi:MAG: fatty acid hydroxylase family protein [Lysobacteraceae bacterium]|nr:MAG: fatty acid hydroxylase family protein [Xanthomonadaceae bacterium]